MDIITPKGIYVVVLSLLFIAILTTTDTVPKFVIDTKRLNNM